MSKDAPYARRLVNESESGPWELREELRARASELEVLLEERIERHPESRRVRVLAEQALKELNKARDAVSVRQHKHAPWRKMGAHLAVGQIHLDTAHNLLLRLSEADEVVPMMPGVLAFTQEHLPPSDPRRIEVERIGHKVAQGDRLLPSDLESILDAVGVAREAGVREALRVRNFVNIVAWVTFFLAVGASLVALLGVARDNTLPLCFMPSQGLGQTTYDVVCPVEMTSGVPASADFDEVMAETTTPADYLLVELVGLVAASLAAATSVRKMRGTTAPYNVPVVLAALKLPTGALTAALGLLLMRGGFVPGLTALDSSAQIIAWAIIFGYSQQLFTRLVDNQARVLVNSPSPQRASAGPPPLSATGLGGQPGP